MKKILILILALLVLLPLVSCGKEEAAEITWMIEDETLIISGNGRMPDYVDENGEMTARPLEDEIDKFYYIEVRTGITYIGKYAFYGCVNAIEVSLPHGITEIGDSAFERCLNLGDVELPAELEVIGNNAFKRCYSLINVNLRDKVKTIGDGAFETCFCLQKVKIKDGVESIGKKVFTDHNYSYTVEFEGTKARWEEIGGAEAVVGERITVKCSDGVFGE